MLHMCKSWGSKDYISCRNLAQAFDLTFALPLRINLALRGGGLIRQRSVASPAEDGFQTRPYGVPGVLRYHQAVPFGPAGVPVSR